jgi:hypothetical protein
VWAPRRRADQIFAPVVLELGGALEVIVPAEEYRAGLPAAVHAEYDRHLAAARAVTTLPYRQSTSESHMAAARRLLDAVDRLVAVWDGQPARGFGGTADVVHEAEERGIPVDVVRPAGARRGDATSARSTAQPAGSHTVRSPETLLGTSELRVMSSTNVTADAVNRVQWLSTPHTSLVVPIYQRQYRWQVEACERLLADIRSVADADDGQTHFFGSILHTATSDGPVTERMLVDGQQRVTRSCSCWRRLATHLPTPAPGTADSIMCSYTPPLQWRPGSDFAARARTS